jgi:tetratricopeptide (TPR) repeat protein
MSEPEHEGAGVDAAEKATPPPAADWDPLKLTIALSLAALVVLGAGLAVLQVNASANESNTARETTRVAVRAMRANVVANTVAGLTPELQAERDFLPFRRPLTAGTPSLEQAAGLPRRPGSTATSLRTARQAVPDLGVDALLSDLQVEAQRMTLQQRALATTRVAWNTRSTQYTTVIAVLAVALFLVGFALAVAGPIRRSAYTLGMGIGALVVVSGLWFYHLAIPSTPSAAIEATARAAVSTANDHYRAAIGQYDRALAADGSYATALSGRSRARLLAANPDYRTTGAVTDLSGGATAAALSDARRALEVDGRDRLSLDLVALTAFYRGDYAQAVDAADRSLAINPKTPDLWLLKSAAQVARGDQKAGTASLERALALLQGAAPSQRTRLLASAYLNDLAWIERHAPSRAGDARRLADRIVAIETAFTLDRTVSRRPPPRGTVAVQNLRYAHGRLTLRLRWRDLPTGTALSALGYELPIAHGAWAQPSELALFAAVKGSGVRDISVPLERTCKPTKVRVDVYLNGARTLSRIGPGVTATC